MTPSESVYTFDAAGSKLGEKLRTELDKLTDIVEAVYAKVFVHDKEILSMISATPGGLPKMNEGKWGAPIATLIRVGETPEDAYNRAAMDELGQMPPTFGKHPRTAYEFSNGSKRFVYQFEARLDEVPEHPGKEFKLVDSDGLAELIQKGEVAETYWKLS